MVVSYSSIRPHLQQRVLGKVDFVAFSRFSQCSKSSQEVSKSLLQRLPWRLDIESGQFLNQLPLFSQILGKFPVKIKFLCFSFRMLYKETIEKLVKLGEGGKIQMSAIIFHDLDGISLEDFIKLIKVFQVQRVIFHYCDENIIQNLQLPELTKIDFHFLTPPSIDGVLNLCSLKTVIFNTNFSPPDFNFLLQQWHEGSLFIRQLKFYYSEKLFELENDDVILSGIPYEIMQTEGNINTENFGKRMRNYILKRGEEKLFLHICEPKLCISFVSDPNVAFKSCKFCVQKPKSIISQTFTEIANLAKSVYGLLM